MLEFVLGLNIFWRLFLAHLLADFTLQTNRLAAWKRKSPAGTSVHSLIFGLSASVLCWPYTVRTWHLYFGHIILPGWAIILILTALHFAEDQWRVSAIIRRGKEDSFAFFAWDQCFHAGVIFLLSPAPVAPVEKWVMLAIIVVFVTHFSTILIYYLEKLIMGSASMEPKEKYKQMAERTCLAAVILLPGWWGFVFASVWTARSGILALSNSGRPAHIKGLGGNVLALLAGIVARELLYATLP